MSDFLLIDIETYSHVDLKRHGVYRYAADPTTEITLLGYTINGAEPVLVDLAHGESIPGEFMEAWLDSSVRKVAFNAGFERQVLARQIPFSETPPLIEHWYCVAHQCRAAGAPTSLDLALRFLGADHLKDMEGHRLMLKFCKPDRFGRPPVPKPGEWERFQEYCIRDVETELLLYQNLPPLADHELEMYHLTEYLNDRGVGVDVRLIRRALKDREQEQAEADYRFHQIVGGQFTYRQVGELKKWVEWRLGIELPDLRKETIERLMEEENLPDDVIEALQIRLEFGRAATKKFQAALDRCGYVADGFPILPGLFMTHAAVTGRFSSKGVQVHNIIRKSAKPEEVDAWLDGNGDRPPFTHLLRPMLIARQGKTFLISDYAAVEARGVAWLAGEEKLLKAFRSGEDVYCSAWQDMFGETITKESDPDKRFVAKGIILGSGYMGGVGAITRSLGRKAEEYTEEELQRLVWQYRQTYYRIPQLWRRLEGLLFQAMGNPGYWFEYEVPNSLATVGFRFDKYAMQIRLPSGRIMTYLNVDWDERGEGVTYARPNRRPKKGEKEWPRAYLSGPALIENITQGHCHDILREAIRAAEKNPDFIVRLHVHDELVCEVATPMAKRLVPIYEEQIMLAATKRPWMQGFPLAVETTISKRYAK